MRTNRPSLRMTRQRRVILEELRKFHHHPSAEEIHAVVKQRLPRISLGTVYRNLDVLAELGEIRPLEFGGTIKRFDGDPEEHYHIRCNLCDRVDNAPMERLSDMEKRISRETDYRIIGHRLEFFGLCPECAKNIVSPGLGKLLGAGKNEDRPGPEGTEE